MRKKRNNLQFEKVVVTAAAAKGKSLGHAPDGKVIFLANAIPGDVVDVRTTKKRKSYYEGIATQFHKLSEKREIPLCRHFGICGGCKWQHMQYKDQLYYKQNEVTENLKRIGGLQLPEVSTILGSEEQYYYRNKMEFSFSDNRWLSPEEISQRDNITDRNALGLHIPGMWDKVLDLEECHLQRHPSDSIRLEIRRFATEHGLSFFNQRRQEGMLRTLMIRTATKGEVMVLLQFFDDDPQLRERLLEHIRITFPEVSSLLYVINRKANDTLYDQEVIVYSGNDHITEEMEGLRFKITAKSFYQTNSRQAQELYKVARDFAGLQGQELVYDLYTGTGTIALFLSAHARKIVGIEAVPEAIEAAKENAGTNQITNTLFFSGDMKDILNDEFLTIHGKPDVVITDPPRDGMHKQVVEQLRLMNPSKIVYVSCNSATQARDLAMLKEDYDLTRIQPVDMFPQTYHVENVVLLEKRAKE